MMHDWQALVDELEKLNRVIKARDLRAKEIKSFLVNEFKENGKSEFEGSDSIATVSETETKRFSVTNFKKANPHEYEEYVNKIDVVKVHVRKKDDV